MRGDLCTGGRGFESLYWHFHIICRKTSFVSLRSGWGWSIKNVYGHSEAIKENWKQSIAYYHLSCHGRLDWAWVCKRVLLQAMQDDNFYIITQSHHWGNHITASNIRRPFAAKTDEEVSHSLPNRQKTIWTLCCESAATCDRRLPVRWLNWLKR